MHCKGQQDWNSADANLNSLNVGVYFFSSIQRIQDYLYHHCHPFSVNGLNILYQQFINHQVALYEGYLDDSLKNEMNEDSKVTSSIEPAGIVVASVILDQQPHVTANYY